MLSCSKRPGAEANASLLAFVRRRRLFSRKRDMDGSTYKLTALTEQIMIQSFQIVAELPGKVSQRE